MARPAASGHVCLIRGGHAPVARMAAGATWRLVIASAPWAVRRSHTSVVDAAGAIYVLGGCIYEGSAYTFYNDVWASTDRGARPHSRRVGTQRGTQRVLSGYSAGTHRVLNDFSLHLRGTLRGYVWRTRLNFTRYLRTPRATREVLNGYLVQFLG